MNRCFIMQLLLFLSIFATFLSKDSKYFINPPQNKTLLYTFLLLFNIKTKHETVLTKNMKKKKQSFRDYSFINQSRIPILKYLNFNKFFATRKLKRKRALNYRIEKQTFQITNFDAERSERRKNSFASH